MRILIVDDDLINQQLLKVTLRQYATCDVASDGVEAIEKFKEAVFEKNPYALIFLDIMMPKLDGHDTLKEIRKWEREHVETGKECKIIMLTALKSSRDVLASFKEGCEGYIIKPVTQDALFGELEKLGYNLQGT